MSTHSKLSGHHLTAGQRQQFIDDGYLGPLAMCSPDEMAGYRSQVEQVLLDEAPLTRHWNTDHNRHLDHRVVYELCTHPAILGSMTSLYGPDLLLWRSNFFVKPPGAKEIPWHQDANYWPLEPAVIISAWIAIDEATTENACMQVIPGTHRRVVPHIAAPKEMQFHQMADPAAYDESQAVDIEMKPGEFILFNERTLHHSEVNRSDKRRIGLAVRNILPIVNVLNYDSDEHGVMLVAGEDRMQFNRTAEPPAAS